MRPARLLAGQLLCRWLPPLLARKAGWILYPAVCGYRDNYPFQVRAQTGSWFLGSTANSMSRGFSLVGYNDWRLWATALALCSPGDTIVEVGANIGTETIGFSDIVGEEGRVIAFEPAPPAVDVLHQSLALKRFSNVDVFPLAVGDKTGQVKLYIPPHALDRASLSPETAPDGVGVDVDCVVLDALQHEIGSLRMLFVDTEGCDVLVLRGARTLISTHRPDMVVEANPTCLAAMGSSADELMHEISKLGYAVGRLSRLGVDPITSTDFAGYHNWLCVSNESHLDVVGALIRKIALRPCLPCVNPLTRPRRLCSRSVA